MEPAQAPHAVQPTNNERTVLVVEDEDSVREVLVEVLTQAGNHVYSAAEPEQAATVLRRLDTSLDLLITDVVMPGVSGHVLARQLRRTYPTLPVLLISGYSADTLDLSNLPGARLLTKPLDLDQFLGVVADLLQV